jgi:putative phosphotransacetylase
MMVSVLGPTRKDNQIELSYTDARALGLKGVPVRESGDVAGTPGLKMVGPAGELEVEAGAIIAKRHIHMTPADAEGLGVTNGEVVKVLVKSERTTIFDDVVVRVSPSYALAMHIDTDECNAAAAFGEIYGEIVRD